MPYRDTPKITRDQLPGYGKPAKKRQGTRSPLKDLACLTWECQKSPTSWAIEFPLRTISEANTREHRAQQNKRKQVQQQMVRFVWSQVSQFQQPTGYSLKAPLLITITRIGPRKLDSDNLARSQKAVRDQVAKEIGIDDGSDLIEWRYAQEPGSKEYRVRIEIREKR